MCVLCSFGVLGSAGHGKQFVGQEEDITMNLLKQILLCSCLSLPRLGELIVTSPGLQHRHVEAKQMCALAVAFEGCFSPLLLQSKYKEMVGTSVFEDVISLERKTGRRKLTSTEGLNSTKHSLSSCSFFLLCSLCSSMLSF